MADNKIVKHRRGTTEEWEQSNIVPEEGELVLEEFNEGLYKSYKCKIGDGKNVFSDLPYISGSIDGMLDDETLNDLLEEIRYELSSKIKNDVADAVSESFEKLTTNDENLLNKINDVANKAQENLASLQSQHDVDNEDIKAQIAAINSDANNLNVQLTENYKKLSDEILALESNTDSAIETLEDSFNTFKTNLNQSITINTNKIASLEANAAAEASRLNEALNGIGSQFEKVNTNILDHSVAIGKNGSDIEKLGRDLDDLDAALATVESRIDSIVVGGGSGNSGVSEGIFDIIKDIRGDIADTKQSIDNLIIDISDLDVKTASISGEIVDARTDYFGEQHVLIGDAIRDIGRQIVDINSRITNLGTELGKEIESSIMLTVNEKLLELSTHKIEASEKFVEIENELGTLSSNISKLEEDIQNIIDNGITINPGENPDAENGGSSSGTSCNCPEIVLPEFPEKFVDGLSYNEESHMLWLTAQGEQVGEAVEVTGGGGSGGIVSNTIVKVQNNGRQFATYAKDTKVYLDFTYSSLTEGISNGDGTFYITINDKKINGLSGIVYYNLSKQIEISEYLSLGPNAIKVVCMDSSGYTGTMACTIDIVELKLSAIFDSTQIYSSENPIYFEYKATGKVNRYVHIFIDDEEIYTSSEIQANAVISEYTSVPIRKQTHGSHKLTAYITATVNDTENIVSNILEYEIICVETGYNEAILTSIYDVAEVTEGDLISIPYMIYDPDNINSQVDLIIYSEVSGELIEESKTSIITDRTQQFWKTRLYPVGEKIIFAIKYTYDFNGETRTISKMHAIKVNKLNINISAAEDSLQLYLTAQGRQNTEENPAIWTYTQPPAGDSVYEPIITEFTNFNWKSNGWVSDTNGDACLRLNGDARAVIKFRPFETDFKQRGKTIEFEFAVRDVNSREAVVIDCFDGERGFKATPDTAFMQSSGTAVSCRYKDNEKVRVAITVERQTTESCFVSIYLDGVLSGIQRYTKESDRFDQNRPTFITLGSSLCGLDIYSIRIYDKALSTAQILNNYIVDKADPAEKLQLVTDNNLLDDDGNISYEKAVALGQIPIITFTGKMPTYKGDKRKNSVWMKFEDPAHPELNFNKMLKEIDVQGTSSQFYVRKNWKIKFDDKIQHMPDAIPAKVYCIKVDYAEATGTHNTGTANYVETLYDREQVILPPQKDDTRVRTTIQGFPVIIFEKETEDSIPVFSSKGNFNYDKGAENAFGFTEDYDDFGVECWEFCNNTSDSVNFVGAINDTDWLEDFEPRYAPNDIFSKIEDLVEAKDLAENGTGNFTAEQQASLDAYMASCISNFKEMHDWVLSTATYTLVDNKRVYINDDEAAELPQPIKYGDKTYTRDTKEYRLAKFKNEFNNYFNMHYTAVYYVFTFFALMVDQRAKNLFLTRWKDDDGVHRWYPYFYDNDTIFGINNEGALVFDYYHEDIDQLGSSNVYNGQNSVFWNNFRDCFPDKIKETYTKLRSDEKLTYNVVMDKYVTQGSDKWSAAIYNADAEYKYVSMARHAGYHEDENGNEVYGVDASNLYQVRGPGEHHLRYFIDNRVKYCDSKWFAGNYPSNEIFLRIYTPKTKAITEDMDEDAIKEAEDFNARITASLEAVPADPSITVTPFSDMYAGITYKANNLQQKRLSAGKSHTFMPLNPNETFNDTETAIYGASEISSLGDLSGLYCGVISLGSASKLTEIKMGSENPAYFNDNFREISVGANKLLRKIDLRNCSGLGIAGDNPQKTLDLTNCPNIEHIYTEGTNLNTVAIPDGGYIKTLHLPASTNAIIIKNQKYLTHKTDEHDGFYVESYKNVKTLTIENCSQLNTNEILAACCDETGKYTVESVRLTGINWEFENTDFIKSLYPVYDEDGILINGVRGTDDKNNPTKDAYLIGTCYIEKLTGNEYAEIKEHYPYLEIKFGEMSSDIIFMSTDGKIELHRESVICYNSELASCEDPVLAERIAKPTKDSTAEFDYEWVGWTTNKEKPLEPHVNALYDIAGDKILYPAFNAIRRKYKITFLNVHDSKWQPVDIITEYGADAIYSEEIPVKANSTDPDIYDFIGWYPAPTAITGDLTCYAQFAVNKDKWYILHFTDLLNVPLTGNITGDGYILNKNNMSMEIRGCNNKLNAALEIPNVIETNEDGNFEIVTIGGFNAYNKLEHLRLPETLKKLSSNAFAGCENLLEVALPSNLTTLGSNVFSGCNSLEELYIPASVTTINDAPLSKCTGIKRIIVDEENENFIVKENCLIDKNKKIIQGIPTIENNIAIGKIPSDGSVTSLGNYAFSGINIESVEIPEIITVISNNAFSRCEKLTKVILPNTVQTLDATCFAWCYNLTEIDLPEGLVSIKTYVFNACNLSEVTIPSTTIELMERSFGDISNLKTVTFKKNLDKDGNIIVPTIHKNAFINSGGSEGITFNVPWSEDYDYNYTETIKNSDGSTSLVKIDPTGWGATKFKINYDCEEVTD